jgi:hypothetical protein
MGFMKAGRPDGHDGRPDGSRVPSLSPLLARRVRRRPDGLRTGCERACERSTRVLVLKSLTASRPNGNESRPNAWLFSFHFAHET